MKMTENEALEMCNKINQEKQVVLEDVKEAIIDKLEEYIRDADKAISDDDFYVDGYKMGVRTAIEIVKEVMKDGE